MSEKAMTDNNDQPLLELKDLKISFTSSTGVVDAVRGVNLTIYPGQSVACGGVRFRQVHHGDGGDRVASRYGQSHWRHDFVQW